MKIAITTKYYFPILGGSIIYAEILARSFVDIGHEVKLITRTHGEQISDTPFPVIRNPSKREYSAIAEWADVLLQVESSWRDALPFLIRRKPWFPTLHRGKPSYLNRGLSSAFRLLLESISFRMGRTIAVSNSTRASWKLHGPVIPNPYNTHVFCMPDPAKKRDVDVLFVGRITENKGVFVLIEALVRLKISRQLTHVAFIGDGEAMADLKLQSTRLLPGCSISFPGMLPANEVADWMKRSHVLAFPTTPDWVEAGPLTPLEAAACGCWVVASDIGGTSENIPPEHWLVEPGSVESLETALAEALATPNNSFHLPTREFLRTREIHSTAQSYIRLFEQALS